MQNLIDDISFTIIDVETTGFNAYLGDRICEIALLRKKGPVEESSYHTLINPGRLIPEKASFVNGITNEMVKDSPKFGEVIGDILQVVNDSVIVCHNAAFDLEFICREMKNSKVPVLDNVVVDTLLLARRNFNFLSNALGNIADFLGLEHNDRHRAMGDVQVTAKILDHFNEKFKKDGYETLEDIIKLQGGTVSMPKYGYIRMPPLLRKAIEEKKSIKLKYLSSYGTNTEREVDPIEVTEYKGKLYLIGYCNLKRQQRTFKLSNITDISWV